MHLRPHYDSLSLRQLVVNKNFSTVRAYLFANSVAWKRRKKFVSLFFFFNFSDYFLQLLEESNASLMRYFSFPHSFGVPVHAPLACHFLPSKPKILFFSLLYQQITFACLFVCVCVFFLQYFFLLRFIYCSILQPLNARIYCVCSLVEMCLVSVLVLFSISKW